MYRFVMIFATLFIVSCNSSCRIPYKIFKFKQRKDSEKSWEHKKNNVNEALSAQEYCVYCMGGGGQSAVVRLKEASYKLEREGRVAITAKDKMRTIIKTWTNGVGIGVANSTFSNWYGYNIDETSSYLLAMRIVRDVTDGTLNPDALREIHRDLPAYGKELYRIRYQQTKLLELAQDIDTYAVPPHGACGMCVRMEQQRRFSEAQNQANYYR